MRQYLYLFWGLVIAGMVVITLACPECRQAATGKYSSSCSYAVYDQNGDRIYVSGSVVYADAQYKKQHIDQSWF
jgi:hypothetical protein